jgi:hypothetical protein
MNIVVVRYSGAYSIATVACERFWVDKANLNLGIE